MRIQLVAFAILAGSVAGCASPPPPPPPIVAVEPAPAPPPPVAAGPIDGMYKGAAVKTDDSGPRCRRVPATATTRVRNNAFVLGGVRGRVGPDGAVTAASPRGPKMTGTLSGGTLDVTTMTGPCGTHYTLTHG